MLSPDEIRVKEFLPTLRGYDADEVRAFLFSIAETVQQLQQGAAAAAAPAASAGTQASPVVSDAELSSKVTRLAEELELAIWTMRRLESAVLRLEERLDEPGRPSILAS